MSITKRVTVNNLGNYQHRGTGFLESSSVSLAVMINRPNHGCTVGAFSTLCLSCLNPAGYQLRGGDVIILKYVDNVTHSHLSLLDDIHGVKLSVSRESHIIEWM